MNNSTGTIAPERQLRCAIYTQWDMRVAQTGFPLEQQRICREAIASNGMIVEEQFVISDVSASEMAIPETKAPDSLLAAATQNPRPFDFIVVDDVSSLGNGLAIVQQVYERLKYYGVELHFVAQELDSIEENLATFLMLMTMVNEIHMRQHGKSVSGGRAVRSDEFQGASMTASSTSSFVADIQETYHGQVLTPQELEK